MATALTKTVYTPEDLLRMPDGDRYELVDGNLVERTVSTKSSFIAGRLHSKLLQHCETSQQGWAFPEGTSYQCFPDAPSKVRRADASFIRLDRLSVAEFNEEGHLSVSPDLAAEVVSPNDTAFEVEQKVDEFLSAGVSLVWVLYPQARTVRIHRRDGTVSQLREADELTGESVLQGFQCRVGDLFLSATGAK